MRAARPPQARMAPVEGSRPTPPAGAAGRLLALRPWALWSALRAEPVSFWMLCAYFFVEYVRPQMIYPVIANLPLGRLTLGLALLAFLFEIPSRRRLHLGDGLLVLFAGVVYLSGLLSTHPDAAAQGHSVLLNWLLVYILTAQVVTTPRRMFLFLGLFLLWSLKLSLFGARTFALRGFGFTDWGIMGPAGWFQNSGELAVQMCVFFAMSLYFVLSLRDHLPRWAVWSLLAVAPGTAALTIIGSSSRGSLLALAAIVLVVMVQSRSRVRSFVLAGAAILAFWALIPQEQRDRLDSMGEDQTSTLRIEYWNDGIEIMNNHPVLGIGYRNWIPYYRNHYNPVGELPHNIFIEAGAELGYSGLLAFLLLVAATLVLNRRTRRLAEQVPEWGLFLQRTAYGLDAAMIGFLVGGFFVTILYYPYFWVNLAFTAALYESTRRVALRNRRSPVVGSSPVGSGRARALTVPLSMRAAARRSRS